MKRKIRIQASVEANLSCVRRSTSESMLRIAPLKKPISAAC
jgi:hypothetical protein